MPCGVYLPPSKDVPMVAPKTRNPRTYAYFSIPKIFAQNIDKDNKVSPITQIHAIKASTTTLHGKSRYVCACMLVIPHHITSHHNITQHNPTHHIPYCTHIHTQLHAIDIFMVSFDFPSHRIWPIHILG